MEISNTTIASKFFDKLWPLILDFPECEEKSAYTSECSTRELLANNNCHGAYVAPFKLECQQRTEKPTDKNTKENIQQMPYRGPDAKIVPLDQQLAIIQQDVDKRQKLAHDFVNRTFPWYIQRPEFPCDFKITADMKQLFKHPLELEILQHIQRFRCHLIIIDVALTVPLKNLECWLKFAPYAALVTVIHDAELYCKVESSSCVFEPVFKEENADNLWQEELERSLDVGVEKAKELFLPLEATQVMVFLFSENRGICVCNKFKVLRKS